MASGYLEHSQQEAQEIAHALQQIDTLLGSEKLGQVYQGDILEIRRKVRTLLGNIRTDLAALAEVEASDLFKSDPTQANRRYLLIKNIESAKIEFEFDVLPALEKITRQAVENSKINPPQQIDESALPPLPTGEKWSVQKVLDVAEQLVEQAGRAGAIVAKAYPLVKALGLIVGIPIP